SKDKTGLGYGDQLNEKNLSDSGLFISVFDSRSSVGDDNQTNDRFKKDNEYHAVPLPLTRKYIPPLADLSYAGLDDFVYRPTTNKTSASVSQVETSNTPPSNTSVEMPRVESVRPSGVIIKDWVSDDDEDIFQSNGLQAIDKPSFKKIEFTNARNESVKPKQAEKPRITTQNLKVDRRDWNGKMTQKLGLGSGSTKKACFVCGSYSHLIKDCDFHEKRMAKKYVLKNMGKNTGQREIRPVWNNVQRINHQNKFVLFAVLTRSEKVQVSTAKKSSLRATTSTSTFRLKVFYKPTTPNTRISNEKVNTVRVNGVNNAGQTAVSAIKGNGVTAVKAPTGYVWRPKMTNLNNVSEDNSGSWVSKRGNPQQALKNKGIFDCRCSRHITGNKDFFIDYQDIDGGFVAFGGSARGGQGPNWLFDIDSLTNSMNYQPDTAGNQSNKNAGPQETNGNTGRCAGEKPVQKPSSKNQQTLKNVLDKMMDQEKEAKGQSDTVRKEFEAQFNDAGAPRTSNDVGPSFVPLGGSIQDDPSCDLEDNEVLQILAFLGMLMMILIWGHLQFSYADSSYGCRGCFNNMELQLFWVEAMQEELLQFKIQKVWTLVDLPYGKKAIGTKWVYRNKKDERGIVVRNKARLVSQGYKQKEGIDYDKVFAPIARIEAIQVIFGYASIHEFSCVQIGYKSAFLYATIKEEVYVSQPLGFVDPEFPKKVYKVEKALYGLHQAPRAWKQKRRMDLQLGQDKYVVENLKIFGFSSLGQYSTPMETNKGLTKDEYGEDVDIIFSVCACSRFQVQPKVFHLNAVKRIFRNLKGWTGNPQQEVVQFLGSSCLDPKSVVGLSDTILSQTRFMLTMESRIVVAFLYLLTKAFDVTRFQFLIASIGLELQGYLINDGYADLVKMLGKQQLVVNRTMSSPNHSTSDIEDAFSSMNILNYTSVSSDYFPVSLGSNSFNSSENSNDNMIPPVFSSFYNNTYLKDVQAIYAKELPISSPDPITPPAILTLSPILPPSLLFNPRYFFIPEELLPPKKRIHSPSSSSTTLSNSSRNQTCDLVSPSSSVYTPTPPQIFEIGKCPIKMYLKHHEGQIEDILNYLDELYLHHIEKMEEGRIDRMIIRRNSDELKTELKRIRT
ncbi:putative ribonuclease H-like domain-containing protein, partial [Tanacetum coccineum]